MIRTNLESSKGQLVIEDHDTRGVRIGTYSRSQARVINATGYKDSVVCVRELALPLIHVALRDNPQAILSLLRDIVADESATLAKAAEARKEHTRSAIISDTSARLAREIAHLRELGVELDTDAQRVVIARILPVTAQEYGVTVNSIATV